MADLPPDVVASGPGDLSFEAVMDAVALMRWKIGLPVALSECDPENAVTVLMVAAAIFSGEQAGMLLAVGAIPENDRQRLCDAALLNFQQGIEFGLKRGLHVISETFAGSA